MRTREKRKTYINPRWYRLDNAAKLYPAVRSKSWGAVFRLAAYVLEDVNPETLQRALEDTLKRFPMFAVTLRRGVFWYYHELLAGFPKVEEEKGYPCQTIDVQDNYEFLFRVSYFQNRISLEIFHSLTDGTGALVLLNTMVAQYLRLRGHPIPTGGQVLDIDEAPDPAEWEDAFKKNDPHQKGHGWKEPTAYNQAGVEMPPPMLRVVHGTVSVKAIRELAKSYNATITELLATALLLSFDAVQRDVEDVPIRPVKVSIPVNMRKFYETRTLRNFSLFANPSLPCSELAPTFREALAIVQAQMKTLLTKEHLTGMMASNMAAEDSPVLRFVPLPIKRLAIKFVYTFFGENQFTTNLSNLGRVEVPEEMAQLVSRYELVMGRSRSGRLNASVISHGDQLVITLTSSFVDRTVERLFFRQLAAMGLHVSIDANDRRDAHGTL